MSTFCHTKWFFNQNESMIGSGSHDVLNSSWLIHFQRQEKQSFIKYDLNKNGTLDFQVGATVSLWLVVEGPLFCLLIYMASVSNIDYHLTIFGLEFGKSFLENSWGWFVWCMNALQWSRMWSIHVHPGFVCFQGSSRTQTSATRPAFPSTTTLLFPKVLHQNWNHF